MHAYISQLVMRNLRALLLLIPCLVVSDHLNAANSAADSHDSDGATTLLILGDSLSAAYGLKQEQGWVSLLQNAWKEQGVRVVNAAISGETTDGGLARLPRLLKQHQPSHILIELGGNDGLQGHAPAKIKQNLAAMIELAQSNDVKVLLQQMQIPSNYGRRYNEMFSNNYRQLAEEYEVILIPFLLQEVALDPDLMQSDGIHPNLQAQPKIAVFMQRQLSPHVISTSD